LQEETNLTLKVSLLWVPKSYNGGTTSSTTLLPNLHVGPKCLWLCLSLLFLLSILVTVSTPWWLPSTHTYSTRLPIVIDSEALDWPLSLIAPPGPSIMHTPHSSLIKSYFFNSNSIINTLLSTSPPLHPV